MPHVEFTAPFDWTPPERPRVTLAYPVGFYTVTRDCADKAVAEGKARRAKVKVPLIHSGIAMLAAAGEGGSMPPEPAPCAKEERKAPA